MNQPVADHIVAVHPDGPGPPGRWKSIRLPSDAVMPSGADLAPGPAGLRMAPGVGIILGSGVTTASLHVAALMDAASSVIAVVEVVGEGPSPSALVCGSVAQPADGLDLSLTGVVIDVDGIQVATAAGAGAAGHPLSAAVQGLSARTDDLAAGTVVFTGRWCPLVEVPGGSHLQASFGRLGGVSVGVL